MSTGAFLSDTWLSRFFIKIYGEVCLFPGIVETVSIHINMLSFKNDQHLTLYHFLVNSIAGKINLSGQTKPKSL